MFPLFPDHVAYDINSLPPVLRLFLFSLQSSHTLSCSIPTECRPPPPPPPVSLCVCVCVCVCVSWSAVFTLQFEEQSMRRWHAARQDWFSMAIPYALPSRAVACELLESVKSGSMAGLAGGVRPRYLAVVTYQGEIRISVPEYGMEITERGEIGVLVGMLQ